MLASLRSWLRGGPSHAGWQAAADWAEAAGHGFKRARDGAGFAIDARAPKQWRLEWGERQRHYIGGRELRLRADLGRMAGMQMLLISRALMQELEREVFEEFTEGVRTRADTETPEEMRWLVMYPKLGGAELGALREHFGGVAKQPALLAQWLQGPLAAALEKAGSMCLRSGEPLVLAVQRGRLTLRTALAQPDVERMQAMVTLFETALRELRRVADHWQAHGEDATSTHPSLWSRSALDTTRESDLRD
jgi:hypothetical protein